MKTLISFLSICFAAPALAGFSDQGLNAKLAGRALSVQVDTKIPLNASEEPEQWAKGGVSLKSAQAFLDGILAKLNTMAILTKDNVAANYQNVSCRLVVHSIGNDFMQAVDEIEMTLICEGTKLNEAGRNTVDVFGSDATPSRTSVLKVHRARSSFTKFETLKVEIRDQFD